MQFLRYLLLLAVFFGFEEDLFAAKKKRKKRSRKKRRKRRKRRKKRKKRRSRKRTRKAKMAQSAVYIEPMIGYQAGSSFTIAAGESDGGSEVDVGFSDLRFGAKVGYRHKKFLAGINFQLGTGTGTIESSSALSSIEGSTSHTDFGIFLGYLIPKFGPVYFGYDFMSTINLKSDEVFFVDSTPGSGTQTLRPSEKVDYSGSTIRLGAGYQIPSAMNMTVGAEVQIYGINSEETDVNSTDISGSGFGFILGLSLPWEFLKF